jgi:hypothetical protein
MKDESGWLKLKEVHKINPAIMLPGHVSTEVVLPAQEDSEMTVAAAYSQQSQ